MVSIIQRSWKLEECTINELVTQVITSIFWCTWCHFLSSVAHAKKIRIWIVLHFRIDPNATRLLFLVVNYDFLFVCLFLSSNFPSVRISWVRLGDDKEPDITLWLPDPGAIIQDQIWFLLKLDNGPPNRTFQS